jgi:hypothetical protein
MRPLRGNTANGLRPKLFAMTGWLGGGILRGRTYLPHVGRGGMNAEFLTSGMKLSRGDVVLSHIGAPQIEISRSTGEQFKVKPC